MEKLKFTITHILSAVYSQTENICYIVLCARISHAMQNMHQKCYNTNVLSVQKNKTKRSQAILTKKLSEIINAPQKMNKQTNQIHKEQINKRKVMELYLII